MKWDEISVRTSHAAMQLVASILDDLGAAGVAIEDPALINEYIHSGKWDYTDIPEQTETEIVTVQAYLPDDDALPAKKVTLLARLSDLRETCDDVGPLTVSEKSIADEDWSESWKQYFHTVRIGERVVIQPSWEHYEAKENDAVIVLDPGAAFGTGTHPTTSMCLRALEKLVQPGMKVFDVGTGSGVLAIGAMLLGAGEVTAVDYDETALHVARENIAQNGLTDKIEVFQSDIMTDLTGKAALVTANIIADIIIRLLAQLNAHLVPGGTLLASGIIEDRAEDVRRAAALHGFAVVEETTEKEWVAMIIRRAGEV